MARSRWTNQVYQLWAEYKIPIIIVILILFLRIGMPMIFNHILSLVVLTLVFYVMTRDFYLALSYAIIVTVLLMFARLLFGASEGFEVDSGKKAAPPSMSSVADAIKKLENLSTTPSLPQPGKNNADTMGIMKKDGKIQAVHQAKLEKKPDVAYTKPSGGEGLKDYSQWTKEEEARIYKNLSGPIKTPNTSGQAQKDLFHLIDTVQQLQQTVEGLSPVIKEGKKIMDAFEALKI